MRNQSQVLESFIQQNYPGVALPPLWQVIYQEAIRGHHLLFRRIDVERFDAQSSEEPAWGDHEISDELEMIVLRLVGSPDLQAMVRIIDNTPETQRKNLYQLYRRVLWMWRNYIKDQLN